MTDSTHINIINLGEDSANSLKYPRSSSSKPRAKSAMTTKRISMEIPIFIPPRPFSGTPSRYRQQNKGVKKIIPVGKIERQTQLLHLNRLEFDADFVSAENSSPDPPLEKHTHPTGASSSGYYSKIRSEQDRITSPKALFSISELMHTIPHPKGVVEPIPELPRIIKPLVSHDRPYIRPLEIFEVNWMPDPDTNEIETCLAKLTDSDAPLSKLAESLITLSEMIDTEVGRGTKLAKALYDAGMFSVFLELLPRTTLSPEVQAHSCILLNYVLSNHIDANETFLSQGLLKHLLTASEISAKLYLTNKSRQNASRRSIATPEISFTGQLASLTSPETFINVIREEEEDEEDFIKPREEGVAFRAVTSKHFSLQYGAFAKYYTDGYLDEIESMSVAKRRKAISEITSTYQKIDRSVSIVSNIAQEDNYETAMENLVSGTSSMLNAEVLIYKYDDINKELQVGSFDETVKFASSLGLVGFCLDQKQLLNVRDPQLHPKFSAEIDFPLDGRPHSMLATPIFSSGNIPVGVLVALNKNGIATGFNVSSDEYFDLEDEYVFRMIASSLGSLIENGAIQASMANTQKKVTVLLETTKSLGSILDSVKLTKVIMESAKELLNSDRCALFLHDSERKELTTTLQVRDSIEEIRIPSNAGIAGAVFTSAVAINIQDAYQDIRFNQKVDKQTGYQTKTILCMPVMNIVGECIGVMQMINKKVGVFSAEDEMILGSFSSQAAVAIEKSRLFKKTEDMRIYLQSILSSITSCVITLSDTMKLNTMNRPWFSETLGYDQNFMKENSVDKWIGLDNGDLLKDIKHVYASQEAAFATEVEIKGLNATLIVNYQVIPLIGGNGVVMVIDDISSEKRAVMTLGRYMSPALAKQVMEDGADQLGGKRKKVSILFSDIRSFTTLSEKLDPPAVVELLNHHFTDAVNAITEEQGILDKFIGDAVMAVFGVPFASPDDATHACNAALRMRDALVVTNKTRLDQGKDIIKMGIGVNTGMVLSGNIGSIKRMEFSCIGDAVNLASRTEGMTKFYGVQILVTEDTILDTNDVFLVREVDSVIVTGRKKSVRMFELLGRRGDTLSWEISEGMRLYGMALEMYRNREFGHATELFGGTAERMEDGPSKVLGERCRRYAEEPPGITWKGEYTAEGK